MQALLVRVGIDLSKKSGVWNAPVNPDTGEFAYVPILEDESKGKKKIRPGYEVSYEQFKVPCEKLGKKLPPKFYDKCAHLDPDFECLTYGDEGDRGEPIWGLADGDILAFYASFCPVKPCNQKLFYALIGLYVVDRKMPALEIPQEDWHRNAHTRRNPDETDIVISAKPGLSGRLERCIPIGVFCKGAYRVTKELLNKWGGLFVKDGYIQRSAKLPSFCDPDKFYEWFQKQHIRLVARNN
jgi:hypothetical protein